MEPIEISKTDEYLLSGQKLDMSFLKYQMVYCLKDGVKYIKSFNIISKKKILKKVYLKELVPISLLQNPEEIIVGELFTSINESVANTNSTNNSYRSSNKRNPKTNRMARDKAANDLFSNLGL